MSTSLLAIDNMFAPSIGAGTPALTSAATKNTRQFAPTPADNPASSANLPETTTEVQGPTLARSRDPSYNTFINAQKAPIEKPPKDFRNTFRKTIITKSKLLRKVQHSTRSKEQDQTATPTTGPAARPAAQPNLVQQWLAQYSLTVEQSKEGVATKVTPKAGYELAQVLANLKADKSPSVTGQAAKSTEIELLLTAGDKGQLGLKTVLPDTSKGQIGLKTISPDTSKSQIGTKAALPETSKGSLTADAEPGESKDTAKTQISDKTLVVTKDLTSGSKTITAGEKPVVAYRQAVSTSPEAPGLSKSLPATNGKPSDDSEPKILFGPEKSAVVAEKLGDNRTAADQQGHAGAQELTEASRGNGKKQADISSGDSLFKNLDPAHVQVSAGQTKDRGSLTSNNSNSAFEQMFSPNNAQTVVTERAFTSVPSAKTAGNLSNGDVSASIGEQIRESIHNSLRQGDQQITIRLNPPELGRVFIRFQEQGDQIIGLLEVSKTQTRYEIQQALPQIIRNLTDCGIQIKRLEVVQSENSQSEQRTFRDQSLQDGSFQQHGFTERGNPDGTGTNEWLTNGSGYQDNPEPQVQITETSINVLI